MWHSVYGDVTRSNIRTPSYGIAINPILHTNMYQPRAYHLLLCWSLPGGRTHWFIPLLHPWASDLREPAHLRREHIPYCSCGWGHRGGVCGLPSGCRGDDGGDSLVQEGLFEEGASGGQPAHDVGDLGGQHGR